jgi:dihydroorotase
VFPYGSGIGIPADELIPFQATTTLVSAGDAGANNIAAFRRAIVGQTRSRLYAFVHIASIGLTGFPVPELYNIDYAQVDAAAKAVAENADLVIGIKVRMSENVIAKNGLEPLRRAIKACEVAGTGGKVMCHIGGVETPELLSQILDTLRAGDILTHSYSGAPNIAGRFTNIVQDGRLLPAALAAKQRGVVFDVGHGGGSFDYTVAEVAIPGGATPDTISSDVHVVSGNTPGMPYLTWVMSKFLNMGFTLEQVVTMATINPARIINRAAKRRAAGRRPADVSLLEVVDGPIEFVDTQQQTAGQGPYQARQLCLPACLTVGLIRRPSRYDRRSNANDGRAALHRQDGRATHFIAYRKSPHAPGRRFFHQDLTPEAVPAHDLRKTSHIAPRSRLDRNGEEIHEARRTKNRKQEMRAPPP